MTSTPSSAPRHPSQAEPSARNNTASILAEAAAASPRKVALALPAAGDASESSSLLNISYGELASAAAEVQRYLGTLGVEAGDRVALSMPNVPLMPALYYGIAARGAICVPLNPLLSGAELEYHLEDSGAKVLFAFAGTRLAQEAASTVPVKNGSVRCEIFEPSASPLAPFDGVDVPLAPAVVKEQDPAVILYTSGTTGRPKGATLSHANILSNARSCVKVLVSPARTSSLAASLSSMPSARRCR